MAQADTLVGASKRRLRATDVRCLRIPTQGWFKKFDPEDKLTLRQLHSLTDALNTYHHLNIMESHWSCAGVGECFCPTLRVDKNLKMFWCRARRGYKV